MSSKVTFKQASSMISLQEIKKNIFCIRSPDNFNVLALKIFHYQWENNPIYREYIHQLGINPDSVNHPEAIPFLPVSFFKTHRVVTGDFKTEMTFLSSRTTGMEPSRHEVADAALYEASFMTCFERFYGKSSRYCILALLPSYSSRQDSSLVYMVDKLITAGDHPDSGFYPDVPDALFGMLQKAKSTCQPTILFGVTFALLDFAENHPMDFPDLIVMETGGMKGRRKELIREELHERLIRGFGVPAIHSEYGMTELLSQAYSQGHGRYVAPPWMRILIRDMNDPLCLAGHDQTGGMNIIDLANLHSCSFVATQDLGKTFPDGSFEVLGRFDASDIRGCSLLV